MTTQWQSVTKRGMGDHLTVLQSPMSIDYYAPHVLIRKPSGRELKVSPVYIRK